MAFSRLARALFVSLIGCVGGVALADSAPLTVPAGERRSVTLNDVGEGAARRIIVENGFLRAVINPSQGGRIESLIYKKTGQEMTTPRTASRPGGMLSDQAWEQDYWHSDWNASAYEATVLPQPAGSEKAQVRLSARGTVFAGVTISKTITVTPDRCAVQVEYEMTADRTADKRVRLDFWFHNTVAGTGKAFLPSPAGVLTRPMGTEVETWVFEPTRGWNAFITDKGAGMAATMESRRLRAVRSQFSPVSTVEWVWRYVDAVPPPPPKLAPGELAWTAPSLPVKSAAQLGFFSGLKEVTGACDDAVIEMTVERPIKGAAIAHVKVAALADFDGTIVWTTCRLSATERAAAPTHPDDTKITLKAGDTGVYDLSASLSSGGSYVILGSLKRGDKVLATFEKEVVVGKASGTYAMAPDGPREPEAGRRNFIPLHFDFSSLSYETPHVKWAKPYAGGRPKVLALTPPHFEREAVELAERFDMDLSCSYLAGVGEHGDLSFSLGDAVGGFRKEQLDVHLDKLLTREWDVILVGGDAWARITPKAQAKILAKVEAGAGLMVIGGAGPAELKDKLPLEEAKLGTNELKVLPGPHSGLFAGLPLKAMPRWNAYPCALRKAAEGQPRPEAILMNGDSVAVGVVACGKGRIVQLSAYGVVAIRTLGSAEGFMPDICEYEYALLGRLLYFAAGKPSPVNLQGVDCARERVSVRLGFDADRAVKVHLRLRDRMGAVLDERDADGELKSGDMAPIAIPVPATVAPSCHWAEVIVRDAASGATLAWGAGAFPPPKAKIEKWTQDKKEFRLGEKITLTAGFSSALPAGARLRVELWDAFERKTASAEVAAIAPETKVTLPVERMLTPIFEARGMLVLDGAVVHKCVCEAWVKLPRRRDQLMTFFWGYPVQGPTPPADYIGKYFRLFHEMGMNANWGMRDPDFYPAFERLGMYYEVPGSAMRWSGYTKAEIAKDPSLSDKGEGTIGDPGIDVRYRKSGEDGGKRWALRNLLGYNCADENRDPPPDSCFCKICLAAFRKWLQETQYKSLEDLNREWSTAFKSWDEVMPMTEKEVKEHGAKTNSYAAWADQRQFNKVSYANHARAYVQGVLSADPEALAGDSGTQESFPTGGRDYSLLAPAYTMEVVYPGTQTPEQEGFGTNMIRYIWEGYNKPNPRNKNSCWRSVAGDYYGFGIFVSGSFIDPDWTLPTDGRDLQSAIREINLGAGQMLVSAKKTFDPVYLLQSPASLHGAYITGQRMLHSQAVFGYMKLMDDLAVGYRAISYTQVAGGYLQQSGARVLFMPHMVALSEAECRSIREWVEQGGTVVADLQPAIMDEHCRAYDKGQLDDLFGVDRSQASMKEAPSTPDPKDAKKMVKGYWQLQPTGAASAQSAAAWPCNLVEVGLRATSASPLWTAQVAGGETAPVVFHRQVGKGHAYYLACNFFGLYDAKEYSVRARTLREPEQDFLMGRFQQVFEKALSDAGVKVHTVVRRRDPVTGQAGVRMPWTYIYDKDAGAIHYAVIIRDFYIYENSPPDPPARATFDRKAHIYDSISGKYLGYGDAVDLTFNDYTMRLFALLPYRVDRMELAASDAVAPGTDAVIAAKLATSGGPVGSHWFRVDVTRPDGRVAEAYSVNVEAKGGQAEIRVPFALNDLAGKWKVRVQDVATGIAAETVITLR